MKGSKAEEGTVWTVPAGKLAAATTKLWNQLGNQGARVIVQLDDDESFVKRVAKFAIGGAYQSTTSQKLVRQIMGKNFFGVEEAVKHFGVKPTETQLQVLAEVPFTKEDLQQTKDTHILVAVFPLSIPDIRKRVERSLFYGHEDAWYNNEQFAKDKGKAGWYLIRKDIVPNSFSETWQEQQALLAKNEEVPTARVMVYTIIGHYLAKGERLFKDVYVRCSDISSGGHRVDVGYFGVGGLCVYDSRDGSRSGSIGLSVSRRFQSLTS